MMNILMNFFLFTAYALSSGFGLILIKRAVTGYKPSFSYKGLTDLVSYDFILGFFLYALGFVFWMLILSKMKLNVAFPIAMSLFFIVSAFGSYFILDETFNARTIVGMSICLVGIILISTS